MQVNVSGHHVEVTDALREYVLKKLSKLEGYDNDITNVQVTLSVEKTKNKKTGRKAEAVLHISGANIAASAENDDMYAAIDLMVDRLITQTRKHRDRQVRRNHG